MITATTRAIWFSAQVILFEIIYRWVEDINGWTRPEYFVFMGTTMFVNSVVETFLMPNCSRFSELIRTGDLDFALLKPIDPQFLISLERIELPNLSQGVLALGLIAYSFVEMGRTPTLDPPPFSVDENSPAGTVVVGDGARDLLAFGSSPFSLSDDAGDRFSIDPESGVLTTTRTLNFEEATSHRITLKANGPDGATVESTLTIAINDRKESPALTEIVAWAALVTTAIVFYYSLMIALAATSVFFVRNTGLYEFWFNVTVFGRYPRAVYEAEAERSSLAEGILVGFSYVIPILLVVTVPARVLLSKPTEPLFLVLAPALTCVMAFAARRTFVWALSRYRSASS